MRARRRQETAQPRWGWSGAASHTAVPLSASDIDLETLLPGHQSPTEQIALCDLDGRYHRYLHQVELGPTRARRMAALRSLLDQLDLLLSQLNGLPKHLRLRISKQLGCNPTPAERDIDIFQANCNDEEVVQQSRRSCTRRLVHAACSVRDRRHRADRRLARCSG